MQKIFPGMFFDREKSLRTGQKLRPGTLNSGSGKIPARGWRLVIYPGRLPALRRSGQAEGFEEAAFAPGALFLLGLVFFILLRIEDGGDGFIA